MTQVWWTTSQDDLPATVVKRFAGKVRRRTGTLGPHGMADDWEVCVCGSQVMAIVGIEMDQVRKTPAGDVSVPINVACVSPSPACLDWLESRACVCGADCSFWLRFLPSQI